MSFLNTKKLNAFLEELMNTARNDEDREEIRKFSSESSALMQALANADEESKQAAEKILGLLMALLSFFSSITRVQDYNDIFDDSAHIEDDLIRGRAIRLIKALEAVL